MQLVEDRYIVLFPGHVQKNKTETQRNKSKNNTKNKHKQKQTTQNTNKQTNQKTHNLTEVTCQVPVMGEKDLLRQEVIA